MNQSERFLSTDLAHALTDMLRDYENCDPGGRGDLRSMWQRNVRTAKRALKQYDKASKTWGACVAEPKRPTR